MSEGLGPVGSKSLLNISAAAIVDDTTASSYSGRRMGRVMVITAGTTIGGINDCLTITQAVTANQIFSIPNTIGVYLIDFPMMSGIVVSPGAGQVVAISYD